MPTVELLSIHTHQGAVYRTGDRLDVSELTARWLLARGIARLLKPPEAIESPQAPPADSGFTASHSSESLPALQTNPSVPVIDDPPNASPPEKPVARRTRRSPNSVVTERNP